MSPNGVTNETKTQTPEPAVESAPEKKPAAVEPEKKPEPTVPEIIYEDMTDYNNAKVFVELEQSTVLCLYKTIMCFRLSDLKATIKANQAKAAETK